jgi:anthranilate synthase
LYADPKKFPSCLTITARTIEETPIIMAIKHQSLPIAAVQFHPESIYSQNGLVGLKMIANAMRTLRMLIALFLFF